MKGMVIALVSLLLGCSSKPMMQNRPVLNEQQRIEQAIKWVAMMRVLYENQNGAGWGSKEYEAEIEAIRYLIEKQ